uniref:Uncharacterized protein n=1 Tax=Lactuca sativa TaxID=4236 RepID=A0A9R1VE00_LACSA|nr:hypothetical protein LSAT_V11C500274790 [Lactuca sativa]
MALHGSFLPGQQSVLSSFQIHFTYLGFLENQPSNMDVTLNSGRGAVVLKVTNNGDRPIQVGSHYYFIEVNPSLIFDQRKAYGMRLNIPTRTTIGFEVRYLTLRHYIL